MNWNDRDHHAIQRFTRYQTARRNEFNKAKKALDDHRKIQAAEQRTEEKQEILKAKFQIYKEKSKPRPTIEEQFEELQQVADKLGIKPNRR
jgi:hypothetical protein